MNFIRKIG